MSGTDAVTEIDESGRSGLGARLGVTAAIAGTTLLVLGCIGPAEPRIQTGPDATVTPDGLHKVDDVPNGTLFIKPGYEYGSYGEFVLGETVLTTRPGSRTLDESEIASLKERFSEAARSALSESGPVEVSERGPCVALINLALLNLDLSDPPDDAATRFDSIGSVTLVMEIRDGHTGEALLRYGRRERLIGDQGSGFDAARNPIMNLAFHQFVVDFHRAFTEALPRVSPVARTLTCAQRAGLAPLTPEVDAIVEIEAALALTPDLFDGERIYETCSTCHLPRGTGLPDGSVPQLAGQHRSVVIKQLADIRAGNRDNPMMYPFAYASRIGGAQAIADVAGYIATLPISTDTGKGPGTDLTLGQSLFERDCASCHGARGEGDASRAIPRIQAQHFAYLERQFEWIRNGRRRNSDPEMQERVQAYSAAETRAVLDYVSRLEPAAPK